MIKSGIKHSCTLSDAGVFYSVRYKSRCVLCGHLVTSE